jgi:DnaJ-class molecular chaperone
MAWYDDIGSFFGGGGSGGGTDWGSIISKVGKAGFDYYNASQEQEAAKKLQDQMMAMEQMKYDASKSQYDAYMQQAMAQAAAGSGGGGGGGISSAALRNAYGPALAALEPYAKFGPGLMKQGAKAYKRGNQGLKAMQGMAFSDSANQAINRESIPAYQVQIPLPDYLLKR